MNPHRKPAASAAALAARRAHLKRAYGITPEEYDQLATAQKNVCAICKGARRYQLHVDHDHSTMLVRGLLCKVCNRRLLPAAHDDVKQLRAAIRYLQSPPAVKVFGERYAPRDRT